MWYTKMIVRGSAVFPRYIGQISISIEVYRDMNVFKKIFGTSSQREVKAIMPLVDDPEEVRPYFRRMREWFDRLREADIPGARMEILSMGMTGDYVVAAEEGATMVRPGRALFGARI